MQPPPLEHAWPTHQPLVRGPRLLLVSQLSPGVYQTGPAATVSLSQAVSGIDSGAYHRFCSCAGKDLNTTQLAFDDSLVALEWTARWIEETQPGYLAPSLKSKAPRLFEFYQPDSPLAWLRRAYQQAPSRQEAYQLLLRLTRGLPAQRLKAALEAEPFSRSKQLSPQRQAYWSPPSGLRTLDLVAHDFAWRVRGWIEQDQAQTLLIQARDLQASPQRRRSSLSYPSASRVSRQRWSSLEQLTSWISQLPQDGHPLTTPEHRAIGEPVLRTHKLSAPLVLRRFEPQDLEQPQRMRARLRALGVSWSAQAREEELRWQLAQAAAAARPATSLLPDEAGALIRETDSSLAGSQDNAPAALESLMAHTLPRSGLFHQALGSYGGRLPEHLTPLEAFRPHNPFAG